MNRPKRRVDVLFSPYNALLLIFRLCLPLVLLRCYTEAWTHCGQFLRVTAVMKSRHDERSFQLSSYNNNNLDCEYDDNGFKPTLAVGDYVKNVHGGKYQFTAAGFNAAGQEFAELGYASSLPDQNDNAVMTQLEQDLPKWAQRLGISSTMEELQRRSISTIVPPCSVTIQNQERTWEPFYAKIVSVNDKDGTVVDASTSSPFQCVKPCGKLAPMGGAQNPYQPNQPYRDSAIIHVSPVPDRIPDDSSFVSCYFLVIGTEEEQWIYSISLC